MIVDRNVIATDDAGQFIPCKGLAVDLDRRIIRLENSFPNRRQLIIAIDKNGFHEHSSGRHRHLIRSATPKSNGGLPQALTDRAARTTCTSAESINQSSNGKRT